MADWARLEFEGVPIYVHGGKPAWLVPNRAGDRVLRELQRGIGPDGELSRRRFLARLPRIRASSYPGRDEFLSADHVRELWLHVTNRCNMACTHCLFASSREDASTLPTDRAVRLVREAAGLGCRVFALTGGEPLLHPEFADIVDACLSQDDAHVVVLTNATLVERHAEPLRAWGSERVHLQVSLDGLQANHDRIRGAGAFDRALCHLAFLRELGFPATVSMCVDRRNVGDMPGLVEAAAGAGAGNVHFLWYFVRGRGKAGGFAAPETIFDNLRAAAHRAEALGVSIDNIDAMRTQVFAPAGTVHDGTTSGWEAAAVGPDGRLYPSAALVGEEALATPIEGSLRDAWQNSPVLDRMRRATARDMASPLRFLTGGGDSDHSHVHGGTFVGDDPYLPLYERLALWLIAREAGRVPDEGPPRLRLKMGDILETCGAHGGVALVHANCLLSMAGQDSRTSVKKFYSAAAVETRDDILNPVCYPDAELAHIPEELRFRGYGCGSPVMDAAVSEGETVLDLGCGRGVECFIAARHAGRRGRVIGIDMLDSMLGVARRGARAVAARLGYDNMVFHEGFLEALPLESDSVDVVISNCVLNLSAHKRRTFAEIRRVLRPGGRLVVSDVVCENDPPPAIRNDEHLRGECIAGALTQRDLVGILDESGFGSIRLHRRFPYRVVQGHSFFSLTFEARRPGAAHAAGPDCEGETVTAIYRGPFDHVRTPGGTVLWPGCPVELARWEAEALGEQVFVVDARGAVTNLDMLNGCSCALPTDRELDISGAVCDEGQAGSVAVEGARHRVGCMICGAELRYLVESRDEPCRFCGRRLPANAVCANGHFVCDACHASDALDVIRRICLGSAETDMLALMERIRAHPAVPVHGPEHHALVPAVILTTYRNLGGEIGDRAIETAIERGGRVMGGACAFQGGCGAALGVGLAFSIILEADPLQGERRSRVMRLTADIMRVISELDAARCCQRETWMALRGAADWSRRLLPIALRAEHAVTCRQQRFNSECAGAACPLSKAGRGADSTVSPGRGA